MKTKFSSIIILCALLFIGRGNQQKSSSYSADSGVLTIKTGDTFIMLILACGTSFHSGMVARYWIESVAGIPCSVEMTGGASLPSLKKVAVRLSSSTRRRSYGWLYA